MASVALPPYFQDGIRLSAIYDFVEYFGGRIKFKGLTTSQVCDKFVKPRTVGDCISYCEVLKQSSNSDDVGTAGVFISHAWNSKFDDVIASFEDFFDKDANPYIWFDLFCTNQHDLHKPSEWYSTTIKEAIGKFGDFVLILSPWDNPLPLTRTFCLYELWLAEKMNCKFHVAMTSIDRQKFLEDIILHPTHFLTVVNSVNIGRSLSHNPTDKKKIYESIQLKVGFHNFNKIVSTKMANWICSEVLEAIQEEEDELQQLQFMNALALIYENQGRYEESEVLLYDALEISRKNLGPENHHAFAAMNNLANVYQSQGKHEKAATLYKECLEMMKLKLKPDHPDTLTTTLNLAESLILIKKFQEAEPIWRQIYEANLEIYGIHNRITLDNLYNVGICCAGEGNYPEAEILLKDCLMYRDALFGSEHPSTLRTMISLASVYDEEGRLQESEAMLVDCMSLIRMKLGNDNATIMNANYDLGTLYIKMEKYPTAEHLLHDCFNWRKKNLGPIHVDTLDAQHALGHLFEVTDRLEEAKGVFAYCHDGYVKTLGKDNAVTKECEAEVIAIRALQKKRANTDILVSNLNSCTTESGYEDDDAGFSKAGKAGYSEGKVVVSEPGSTTTTEKRMIEDENQNKNGTKILKREKTVVAKPAEKGILACC